MLRLIDRYNLDVSLNKIIYDVEQVNVVTKLDILFEKVILKSKSKSDLFSFNTFGFLKKKESLGIYIWGDVGRGKTYLVDLFYYLLPIDCKLRLHFHHFMSLVHEKLREFSGIKDPLKMVAKMLYKKYVVICLDEFFVKDIGDAMILAKLFDYLIVEYQVFFVFTSNVVPKKLYYNGLQRQRFLPAIALLEENFDIANLDGNRDYRLRNLNLENVFIYPLCYITFKSFRKLFFKLSTISPIRKEFVNVLSRNIPFIYLSGSIVWFDFGVICGNGRSQLDYMEIAFMFDTVFVSNIKPLTQNDNDIVKRFISLVDEFYDKKINLLITADSNIDNLYSGEDLKFDFARTISRLKEMGTSEYLRDFDKYGL